MFFKIIICLLIAHYFEIAESKAWPDQSNGWGNPHYRDYYGQGEFRADEFLKD